MFRLDCFIRQSGLFLFSGISTIDFKGVSMKKIKKIFARGLIFCPSRDLPLEGQKISHLNFDNRIHIHQIRYPSRGESPKPKEGTPRTTCSIRTLAECKVVSGSETVPKYPIATDITGSTCLMNGGTTADYYYGTLRPEKSNGVT
jgi:hypothetical protein